MQKFKVIFSPDPIPETEINQYKDFAALLKSRQKILQYRKWWRVGIMVSSITLIALLFFWNNLEPISRTETKVITSSKPNSATNKNQTTRAEENKLVFEAPRSTEPTKIQISETPVAENEQKAISTVKKSISRKQKEKSKDLSDQNKNPAIIGKKQPSTDSINLASGENILVTEKPADETNNNVETAPVNLKAEAAAPKIVKTDAEPKAGLETLYRYFDQELRYPEGAVVTKTEGIVLVLFTINKRGRPENIKVVKGLTPECDLEAIRLVQGMPIWKPATVNRRPVDTNLTIPIRFQLLKN